jgi:hypothetical protein
MQTFLDECGETVLSPIVAARTITRPIRSFTANQSCGKVTGIEMPFTGGKNDR